MTETLAHLHRLYAETDDPWHFATSPYEQSKFAATAAALSCPRYSDGLEIGCGNGALAQHLAPRCDRYTGIDAIPRAVAAAQNRAPQARFLQGAYPCPLPNGPFDLIILSEVLYFLTPQLIETLAADLLRIAPQAEVICVTYLGDTAQQLQGVEALALLQAALQKDVFWQTLRDTGRYRIDRGLSVGPV